MTWTSYSQGLLGAIFPPYGVYSSFQQSNKQIGTFTDEKVAPFVQGFGTSTMIALAIVAYFAIKNKR